MKKRLYEIAVVSRNSAEDNTLIVPPTPFMATDETAATAQGVLLAAAKEDDTFDPSTINVIVRLFQ